MAGLNLPIKAVRQQISSAIWVVIQALRLTDGKRKVTSIQEITGMEGDIITMQDIFTFARRGVGPNGKVLGSFRPSGIRPKFLEKLRVAGLILPQELFEQVTEVN
jgi:pilus assembly protein CpaF